MIMQHQDNININTNSNSSTSTTTTNNSTSNNNSNNNNCNASSKSPNAAQSATSPNTNSNSNSNNSDQGKPKRNPYCSRCRNHGKIAQVKGHKRHCEYRDCQCEGCKLVECRQIVSAAQIKRRRYQKQDEECGRRIEVSPPVLTRSSNSGDPASLIAKTLIGPAKQHEPPAAAAARYLNTTSRLALDGAGHLAASLASANTSPNLFQMPMWSALSPSVASAAAFTTMAQSWPSHHHQHQHHHHQQPHQHHQPHQQQAAQHHQSPQHQQQPPSVPPPAQPCQRHQVPPLPSPHDQIHQVEELDQAFFAPLVIYAWLKAEHFDLQKIRNIIEMSKAPFDELIHTIIRKREHGQRESQTNTTTTTTAPNEQQQQQQQPQLQQRPTFSDTLVASHQHARKFYPLPWNMF